MNYVRAERILMKSHPEMSEKWVKGKIAEDPSILGLGDLVLRAQERIHRRRAASIFFCRTRTTRADTKSSCQLKYNKFYIGLSNDGRADNFMLFKPKKAHLNIELKMPRSEEVDQIIEGAGIETLEEYNGRWAMYRLRLAGGDVEKKHDALLQLTKLAYAYRDS
ncbi:MULTISPECIES: hypothetical protein [Rhizobium]|nr:MULTISPECIES: hypothetical protein [Rhizobium]